MIGGRLESIFKPPYICIFDTILDIRNIVKEYIRVLSEAVALAS